MINKLKSFKLNLFSSKSFLTTSGVANTSLISLLFHMAVLGNGGVLPVISAILSYDIFNTEKKDFICCNTSGLVGATTITLLCL